MEKEHIEKIIVITRIKSETEQVWNGWTMPEHIIKWNFAADDWHCPKATCDFRVGGKFLWRMEARDGSFGFDFSGTYTKIKFPDLLEYKLDDDRNVSVSFEKTGDEILVTEIFEAENENPVELQEAGWQMILDNFKKHIESLQ